MGRYLSSESSASSGFVSMAEVETSPPSFGGQDRGEGDMCTVTISSITSSVTQTEVPGPFNYML